jgi:hypothetical protein
VTPLAVVRHAVMDVPDPQAQPLTYPGLMPDRPAILLCGSAIMDVTPSDLPVGEWGTRYCLDDRPLDVVLTDESLAPIAERQPVLAIGSNASTAQLWRKFTNAGLRPIVPLTAVTVPGIMAGVSAHVSRPGYLPATPVADPGAVADLFITWLDDEQLSAMDLTEPNYDRIRVGPQYPVTLVGGPAVDGCWLYVSKHGHLTGRDGCPVPLASQENLIMWLLDEVPALAAVTGETPVEWVIRCQLPEVREQVRVMLCESGLVQQCELLRA